MHLQAEGHQGLPETPEGKEKAWNRYSPGALTFGPLDFGPLGSRTVGI